MLVEKTVVELVASSVEQSVEMWVERTAFPLDGSMAVRSAGKKVLLKAENLVWSSVEMTVVYLVDWKAGYSVDSRVGQWDGL